MTNKKASPQKNVETIEEFTPKKPDFKHRYESFPQNNVINASCQISTVLTFLYEILEPKNTLPPAHVCTVERLHQSNESLKKQVMDALFIVDSLNSDILAIAQAME
ncbi:MAG: hypothetical protein PHN45_05495 [Methylococcales bacterium]|nr:hypothetical protein [Methylococcales bacterium]MDD5754190.1 hypothetical protein [Methylococcales bacterium]